MQMFDAENSAKYHSLNWFGWKHYTVAKMHSLANKQVSIR